MEDVVQRLRGRQSYTDGYYDNGYYCRGQYYSDYNDCYSNWYSWGRWIFIAGIVIAFLILFSLCACVTRRRRRRGLPPYYGTAWMPFRPSNPHPDPNGTQFQQYGQTYDPNYTPYYPPPAAPAPPYTPSPNMPPAAPYSPHQQQTYYPPPPGPPPPQVAQHGTGATRESEYYNMPPPGPPPQAHVGKM